MQRSRVADDGLALVGHLLVTAIHAMPGGGTLELAVLDADDGGAHLVVTDTGPGLATELLAQLFPPFVTRKRDGTGLGLWISRSLVARYGGDITATNRSDGSSGAVFTVRLKAEAAADDGQRAAA
jgi:signal transduction histidine kinase